MPPENQRRACSSWSSHVSRSRLSRRGAGQLPFDIGVAGDFIGDLTQNNVQQAQARSWLENYFFPREIELLSWPDRPYARRGPLRSEPEREARTSA